MALDQESFDLLLPTLQRFIQERLVPAESYLEEHDDVPPDIVEDMKEMGLFGLSIPEEFGGIGLSMSQEIRVAYELGKTSLAFRSVFGTNVGIGSQGILMDGTTEKRPAFCPGWRAASSSCHLL
jgi:acyl-CoA dehydrogenase